jgi:hypothetical protein
MLTPSLPICFLLLCRLSTLRHVAAALAAGVGGSLTPSSDRCCVWQRRPWLSSDVRVVDGTSIALYDGCWTGVCICVYVQAALWCWWPAAAEL